MVGQENVLRLLIAEESLNDAEMLISVLRNAGHAVRATRAEDDEDVYEALNGKPFDLFLCSNHLELLDLSKAREIVEQAGKDVPLIAVAEEDDPEMRRQAIGHGAEDMVSKHDLDHLQLVINRELRHLNDRRRLRRVEKSLRETEKRCSALLDNSRDAIAYVHEGMHIYANSAYLEKFGYADFDEIEGMPILDMIDAKDQAAFKDTFRKYSKGDHSEPEMDMAMRVDGETQQVHMVFSPASIEGEPCTQILIRDTSGGRELEAQLDNLSKQDLLSGLYNRPYFMEALDETLARLVDDNTSGGYGLLYVRVDGFDTIKQEMGISFADLVIGDMATLIRGEIGDEGIAARFEDDVFTLLLPDHGVHETIAVGEALRQKAEEHVSESDGQTVTTTCSVGGVIIGDNAGNTNQLIQRAHQACQVAINEGGNRVHLHTAAEGPEEGKAGDAAWAARIHDALADERFFLVYQPVASLQGDNQERYEVRVRMRDENDAVVEPDDFIPQAEQSGVMSELDRWIISKAIQVLAGRLKDDNNTMFFLKLSAPALQDEGFSGFVGEQLKAHGVPGQQIVLQLNEPVAVTQLNRAKDAFRKLKELRCGFCLDHFGSGLNPFQLVKHIPADYLKIDSTVSLNLSESAENQEAVKGLLENAHAMNKFVIAGYLEDASSMALLWQYGVDFVQGYFLQEPEEEMHYDFSGMVI